MYDSRVKIYTCRGFVWFSRELFNVKSWQIYTKLAGVSVVRFLCHSVKRRLIRSRGARWSVTWRVVDKPSSTVMVCTHARRLVRMYVHTYVCRYVCTSVVVKCSSRKEGCKYDDTNLLIHSHVQIGQTWTWKEMYKEAKSWADRDRENTKRVTARLLYCGALS